MGDFIRSINAQRGIVQSALREQVDLEADITGVLTLDAGGTGASLSDPGGDRLLFWEEAFANVTWLSIGSGLSIVGGALTAAGGGSVDPSVCNGRLTTESGVPVSRTDRTAQGTLYFTPYKGSRISLYDGADWVTHDFTERSLALTMTSGKNYDVFIFDNSGTLTLTLSAAWTDDVTRADALGTQDGIEVLGSDHTKRWLGTIRASAADQTTDSGEPAAGTTAKRFVWNRYNQVPRLFRAIEDADFWTYSGGWRSKNADNTNRVEFVVGSPDAYAEFRITDIVYDASLAEPAVGVGFDSTSAASGEYSQGYGSAVSAVTAFYSTYPVAGYHFAQHLEKTASGSGTFYGDNGGKTQSGLRGFVMG